MPNNIAHFAIEADDLQRARRFYENVFAWQFTPWGPPGFLMIRTGTAAEPGLQGALQRRREPLSGTGNRTFMCTIGVSSLEQIRSSIIAHGGTITMEPFVIVTVGTLLHFTDTEGNHVGVMQYDPQAGVE